MFQQEESKYQAKIEAVSSCQTSAAAIFPFVSRWCWNAVKCLRESLIYTKSEIKASAVMLSGT